MTWFFRGADVLTRGRAGVQERYGVSNAMYVVPRCTYEMVGCPSDRVTTIGKKYLWRIELETLLSAPYYPPISLSLCLASIGDAIRNVKEHVDANDQTRASTCKLYARFLNRMCYVLYRDRWWIAGVYFVLYRVCAAAAPAARGVWVCGDSSRTTRAREE